MRANERRIKMKTTETSRPLADFTLTGTGTVYLFHPLTQTARDWLARYCPAGCQHQYYGDTLAVEHRFVGNIVLQAAMAGLRPLKNSSDETDERTPSAAMSAVGRVP